MFGRDVERCISQGLSLLIDILALSDQNTNQIKVSVLAGSPDMLECLLAIVTLAEIESKSVLRRADFTEDVIVGFPFKKSVANT